MLKEFYNEEAIRIRLRQDAIMRAEDSFEEKRFRQEGSSFFGIMMGGRVLGA